MLIKKDNGKVKMELTEDELIIKGFFKDTKIKRGNIRSAILEENRFLILTYDDKVLFRSITNSTSKYRQQLKVLIDEINKENVIFNTSTIESTSCIYSLAYCIFVVITSFSNKVSNKTLETIVFLGTTMLFILVSIYCLNKGNRVTGIMYNIDKKEFKVIGFFGGIKERFTIENIQFVKESTIGKRYKSKKTGYKFYLENQISPITYPTLYSKEIKEIQNTVV